MQDLTPMTGQVGPWGQHWTKANSRAPGLFVNSRSVCSVSTVKSDDRADSENPDKRREGNTFLQVYWDNENSWSQSEQPTELALCAWFCMDYLTEASRWHWEVVTIHHSQFREKVNQRSETSDYKVITRPLIKVDSRTQVLNHWSVNKQKMTKPA